MASLSEIMVDSLIILIIYIFPINNYFVYICCFPMLKTDILVRMITTNSFIPVLFILLKDFSESLHIHECLPFA